MEGGQILTPEQVIETLAKHGEILKSHSRRIEKNENVTTTIHELAVNVKNLNETNTKVVERLEALETKGSKRWDGIVEKIIFIVVTAVVVYFLANLGL